ncbi:MAG: polyprenyl synthetase family protein [Desulfovibrionaceae bacterium]|nr:polyprenyl synthetase family protein [Desulfovibrionaceae bacterium]
MKDLRSYFNHEVPRVGGFLERETAGLDGLVREVARHVLLAPGKRIRPILTILMARAFGYEGDALPLACALEILHSATLLHDDILDGANLRRGLPAAHTVFGNTETILAGDVLLALANRLGAGYDIPRINYLLAEGIMATAEGEIREIAFLSDPAADRKTYLEIIVGKTAKLIETACRCGAVLGGASRDREDAAGEFGLNLGIAFQLVDDALDYAEASSDTGKPEGGDLREGKVTLPLIYLLEAMDRAEAGALLSRLRAKSVGPDDVREVLRRVREAGLAERTRDKAAEYVARARQALSRLSGCRETDILAQAAEFVLTRRK